MRNTIFPTKSRSCLKALLIQNENDLLKHSISCVHKSSTQGSFHLSYIDGKMYN
jgi:hypothetical protein